jgi:hypothetical protein
MLQIKWKKDRIWLDVILSRHVFKSVASQIFGCRPTHTELAIDRIPSGTLIKICLVVWCGYILHCWSIQSTWIENINRDCCCAVVVFFAKCSRGMFHKLTCWLTHTDAKNVRERSDLLFKIRILWTLITKFTLRTKFELNFQLSNKICKFDKMLFHIVEISIAWL